MTDVIKAMARSWGNYMRRVESGFPPRSTLGRMVDEGAVGAAIRQHVQHIPVRDMPAHVRAFHCGWLTLRERHRAVLFVCHVLPGRWQSKAERLGIRRSRLYELRDAAYAALEAALPADNDNSGNSGYSGNDRNFYGTLQSGSIGVCD